MVNFRERFVRSTFVATLNNSSAGADEREGSSASIAFGLQRLTGRGQMQATLGT